MLQQRMRHLVRAGAALSASIGLAVLGAGWAGAQGPSPAFYTWQAPGGSATYGQRVIALTFDDGPGPYTPQVLSVLEQYHVPATFFEIGEHIAEYPQYTQMLVDAGYPVENHTWSHPDLVTLSAAQVDAQIEETQSEIRSLTGETPACLRPPYDAWNQPVLDEIAAQGLTTMSYSIDPRDWSMPGVTAIVSGVVDAAFPGAVVDLHDGGGDRSETVAALPRIITGLEGEGYRFVSICGYLPRHQTSAVASFGHSPAAGAPATSTMPFSGAAGTRAGYWLTTLAGDVYPTGEPSYGSMGGRPLDAPVVGMAATATGRGYWLVGSDGGVFSFGTAGFHGSMGGTRLNAPVVGIATDAATGGYWEAAADGGVFAFDAPFLGSLGGLPGADRYFAIVGSPGGDGYLLAGEHPATAG
jgi:peptidoglycan-N-acetylglucosamine deacetylase